MSFLSTKETTVRSLYVGVSRAGMDFNLVMDTKEKKGGTNVQEHCREMVENIMSQFGFIDVKQKKEID